MTDQQPEAPAVPDVTRWQTKPVGPVEVEAVRVLTSNVADWPAMAEWCGGVAYTEETPWDYNAGAVVMLDGRRAFVHPRDWGVIVPTPQRYKTARYGWWIIRSAGGTFSACDPDTFAATYEPAPGPPVMPQDDEALPVAAALDGDGAKLAAIRQMARTWAALAPADDWGLTPVDAVIADCGRTILAIVGTEEQPPDVREYRVLFDDEDGAAVLLGPCAHTIGCLFDRKFPDEDGVTLGELIDAATEHEGEQGQRAHARVAEIAAEMDAAAEAHNAGPASQPHRDETSTEEGPRP